MKTGVLENKGLVTLTSGGIAFPATQVPSAGANTLDDYEEGQWTATMVPASGTITLSANVASYTKIGRMVILTGYLEVGSVATPLNAVYIGGLPFTNGAAYGRSSAVSINADQLQAAAITTLMGVLPQNTATIYLYKFSAGASSNLGADIKFPTNFSICITYFVD